MVAANSASLREGPAFPEQGYNIVSFLSDVATGFLSQFTPSFWLQYGWMVLLSVGYFAGGYHMMRKYADPATKKNRGWIISLLSSSLMFTLSAPLTVSWIRRLGSQGFREGTMWLVSASHISNYLMIFFLTFLYVDMVVAFLLYPGHMELLAGWIHHVVYILLISNGLHWGWTNGLAVMFIEELPTMILALGMTYPRFKSELGFGITFAILRLGFHVFVTILMTVYTTQSSLLWLAGLLTLATHCWWFYGWVKRQMKLRGQAREIENMDPDDPNKERLLEDFRKMSRDDRLDSILIDDATANKVKLPRKLSIVDDEESEALLNFRP